MSAAEIVNKVWNYAHVLRALQNPFGFHQVFPELRSGHDGVGYGDYVEQITYLIFLKMADEREKAGQHFKTASGVLPQNCLRQFIRHFLRFAPVASSTSSAALRISSSFIKYFQNLRSQVLVALRSQSQVPNKYAWTKLVKLDGDAKENRSSELQYRHTLENLGKQGGMLGTIFRKGQYLV